MPSSQAAANERRSADGRTVTHEPPKLKTTLKTPPKQATNPLQFVKVGPCSLYRTAQEQLQKVQEVKKIKQEVRDDPEDWQSNLDNWKSSRRKRQEHIIERVVEVKKLELEEHDRHRRRSKTFSEMMEERGNRGRKLSISLAMYQEEDANDLSDLGIGTSSGKSSVSGDTHDDAHSVLSDRDSEIDKNHSDVDNATHENGNDRNDNSCSTATTNPTSPDNSISESTTLASSPLKKGSLNNGFHNNISSIANNHNSNNQQEYDSATTATASSPEPEEYAFEGAIRGVHNNHQRQSFAEHDPKYENIRSSAPLSKSGSNGSLNTLPVVKVDILKRREIFEKASRDNVENKNNNNRLDFANTKSIKERLSILERQKSEDKLSPRHSVDLNAAAIRDKFNREKNLENEPIMGKTRDLVAEELETVKPLRERLEHLEKLVCGEQRFNVLTTSEQLNGDLNAKSIKERLISLDVNRCKESEKRAANCFHDQTNNRVENSTPSERSSSPDSEYRAPRTTFHQSLDSLDADASSGPDTFERVQSLEELDYHQTRRYPASSSSAEILNDTDREDSGIHTADASCSVSQADEPIEEEIEKQTQSLQQLVIVEEKTEFRGDSIETTLVESSILTLERIEEKSDVAENKFCDAVLTETGTADISSSSSTCTSGPALSVNTDHTDPPRSTNAITPPPLYSPTSSQRPVVYQSPRVPPRRSPPEPKPSYLPGLSSSSEPTASPLPSPRSPSKIPTPLPRKTLVSSPTSSPGSPTSSPGSPKFPGGGSGGGGGCGKQLKQTPSEIPVPVKLSPPSPMRRCTVVEVCEKVLLPRGQLQPTPFITVERLSPRDDEVADPPVQNLIQLDEVVEEEEEVQAESELQVQPIQEVDEEEEEEEEVEMAEKEVEIEKQQQQQQYQEEKEEEREPELLQSIEEEEQQEPELVPEFPAKMAEAPPVRPTTLALERTTSICSDFLSPLSPVSKQILPLSFSSDEEIVTGLSFPLGPPTSVEPPKEKPPPPPIDLSDEENHPIEPLKRLNSTRRIKKELRTRRSDFLGIEGFHDDELERELTLTKPPDMAAILAEERRIEQLHRRSYDTDSNYEQDSSHERDSGVELGQAEDWTKQPVSPDMSQHSRQSSEPFGASVTSSEEDEISKKEREIIEVLEREEQWRYENNREIDNDISEKLAYKLRELEEEKMMLERERDSADNQQQMLRMNEENLRKQEELTRQQDEAEALARQQELEKQKQLAEEEILHQHEEEEDARLQQEKQLRIQDDRERRNVEVRIQDELQRAGEISSQESKPMSPTLSNNEDEYASREVLRVERELLQLEQEELKRQRNNLAYREQKQQQLAEQLQEQWKSLQDATQAPPPPQPRGQQLQYNGTSNKPIAAAPLNYRSSMPNLQMQEVAAQRRRPPPPPIPPAKPLRLVEQRQRDVTIRNSRIPSADSIPQQIESPLRPSCSTSALTASTQNNGSQQHHGQQMTRQTLQALSAVPRPRIVQADQWVQRRKSDIPRGVHDYNYQHWLIQEAEQQRISEKNQRSPVTRNPHLNSTSVPFTASPPSKDNKPLPDSIIQTLTQRVQNRVQEKPLSPRRRLEHSTSQEHLHSSKHYPMQPHKMHQSTNNNSNSNNNNNNTKNTGNTDSQEKMLSVSGKKKCSHCGDELGRGAAMIIESLRLFYHMECFKCCVCHVRLGDGRMGTDVRVRNHKLHCHNCYSSDDGVKFSCV